MDWAEIAECLNKQRIAEGKLLTLTGNAVYGASIVMPDASLL
jgi:hypothetical protein